MHLQRLEKRKNPKKVANSFLTSESNCAILTARGISAVGSAQHWQCWGQGFKSPMLHQKKDQVERLGLFSTKFALRASEIASL